MPNFEIKDEPLAIYTFNEHDAYARMKLLDFTFAYISVIWRNKLNDYAQCELKVYLTEKNKQTFRPDNIVYRDEKRAFIITTVTYERTEQGELYIDVKGYSLFYVLTYRVLNGSYIYRNQTLRTIFSNLMYLYSSASGEPLRGSGSIRDMLPSFSTDVIPFYSKTGGTVLEAFQELILLQPQFHFDVYFSTAEQVIIVTLKHSYDYRWRVCFDDTTSSIVSSTLALDENGAKNFVYVYGEDTGTQRKYTTLQADSTLTLRGLHRKELYVDARDLQSEVYTPDGEKIILPNSEYIENLTARGRDKLAGYQPVTSYNAKLRDNSLHIFGEDYDIGDTVSVKDNALGVTVSEIVTGFEETVTAGTGKQLYVNIGQERVDLKKSIKRML